VPRNHGLHELFFDFRKGVGFAGEQEGGFVECFLCEFGGVDDGVVLHADGGQKEVQGKDRIRLTVVRSAVSNESKVSHETVWVGENGLLVAEPCFLEIEPRGPGEAPVEPDLGIAGGSSDLAGMVAQVFERVVFDGNGCRRRRSCGRCSREENASPWPGTFNDVPVDIV